MNSYALEVTRLKPSVFRNARQHFRPNLLSVVKSKDEIWKAFTLEYFV